MPERSSISTPEPKLATGPTLQITIPTYNRIDHLKTTLAALLKHSALIRQGRLKIKVFDNSQDDHAEALGAEVTGLVDYTWNGGNLGYHGNIRRCMTGGGEAVFKWIIADDDVISTDEIPGLIDFLEGVGADVAGVALPYEVENFSKNQRELDISVTPAYGKRLAFGDAVLVQRIPFDFLASFIFRQELVGRIDVDAITSDNDYFHSLVYCSALGPEDKIAIYDTALLAYVNPGSFSWSLVRLVNSKFEICDVLIARHGVAIQKSAILSEILKWAVFGRIGMIDIRGLEGECNALLSHALRDMAPANLALGFMLVAPRFLVREAAILGLALAARRHSPGPFLQQLKTARQMLNAASGQ